MEIIDIVKDASGLIGFKDGQYIQSLFDSKHRRKKKSVIVGSLQLSELKKYYTIYNLNQHLREAQLAEKTIYFVGEVSEHGFLTYVKMNDDIVMGYNSVKDSRHQSNANIYFFKKIGEVEGKEIYIYIHDMVMLEKKISWVHKDGRTDVYHKLDEQ